MDVINSLEDLKRYREEALAKHRIKETAGAVQVFVSMGSCGIAVGAREIMKVVLNYIEKNQVENVSVTQTGCIGLSGKNRFSKWKKADLREYRMGKYPRQLPKKLWNPT